MNIEVHVKPSSGSDKIVLKDERYTVYLKAKPENGQANIALINLLAKHFDVPKTNIKILLGKTSKEKLVKIDN